MKRFGKSFPCVYLLFAFFPIFSANLSEVQNVPTNSRSISSIKNIDSTKKEKKLGTNKSHQNWKKIVKSYYGNSIIYFDGLALSKYEVYNEFYKDLYNLSENKNPGFGYIAINNYFKILKDENKELELLKKETWKICKKEEKIMNEKIYRLLKSLDSDIIKNEKIISAKEYFKIRIYGDGGIVEKYITQRRNIYFDRSYKFEKIFNGYELEVEELFNYYNERWQEDYGLKIFEDKLYDIKIQTLENVPNFYLSY